MSTFQWEFLTSLGFLLFGYDSTFGATTSMLINWSEGLLAVLVIYGFVRTFLGRGQGALAALLYYSMPLVGHFSFADMKIDNAVFLTGALATLSLFLFLFPQNEDESEQSPSAKRRLLILCGLFCGLAFAMKPTAIMLVLGLGAVFLGVSLHWLAALGAVFLIVLILGFQGALSLTNVFQRIGEDGSTISLFLTVLSVLGLGCIAGAAWLARSRVKPTLVAMGILVAALLCSMSPWMVRNGILRGTFNPSSVLSAPSTLTPFIDLSETSETRQENKLQLPAALAIDTDHSACKSSGINEELDRYWGFGKGWSHYLTLPWRIVMNKDAGGYYVTTFAALLLFPLIFLLPFTWTKRGRWLAWLGFLSLFVLVQWVFLANGVPWYGIAMFLGFMIGLEALVAQAPDIFSKVVASVLIGLSLLSSFAQRTWQFEQQRNLLEYPMGKVSAEALRERTIQHYDDIRDIVMDRRTSLPDRPYLYRMGTFIPYFLPQSVTIMPLADNQLTTFNCLYQERDPALTVRRLKALGFNAMIFDTNTATIESDGNGPLHQKVNAFVEFANSPAARIRIIVNDPSGGVAFMLLPDDDVPVTGSGAVAL